MQNVPSQEEKTLMTEINESIRNMPDVRKFIDISKFSFPETLSDAKHRAELNFDNFKGNYFIIIMICTLVFLIKEILSIPLVALWVCYFYFAPKLGDNYRIANVTMDKTKYLVITLGISVVYCLFFKNIIFNLMVTFSIATFLVIGHMIAYEPEEAPLI
ncbi:hypothetical protein DMUE_4756 [Dictyocoela muelleri]|nr:hypothetical protein DMUE_4756 [Dictyocoela muelleri]